VVVVVSPNNGHALSFVPIITINSQNVYTAPAVPFTPNTNTIIQKIIDVFPYFSEVTVSLPYNGKVAFQTALSPSPSTTPYSIVYNTSQTVQLPIGVTLYFKLQAITLSYIGQIQTYTVQNFATQSLLLTDLFVQVVYSEPSPQGTQGYLSLTNPNNRVFGSLLSQPDSQGSVPPVAQLPPFVTLTGIQACVGGSRRTCDCVSAPNYIVGYFPGSLRTNSYDASPSFVGVQVVNLTGLASFYIVKNVGTIIEFLAFTSQGQINTLIRGNTYNIFRCPSFVSSVTISNLQSHCVCKEYTFTAYASVLDYNNF